jgi:hypothetical protein
MVADGAEACLVVRMRKSVHEFVHKKKDARGCRTSKVVFQRKQLAKNELNSLS